MRKTNTLLIMSDEHSREILGCYGNRLVRTPHLDRLARRGTRFTNAYANSPVCVSTRASIATGRYVHQTRCWDGAHPYDGSIPGWGHHLIDAGHQVVSVGKLHYRSTQDANGFKEEIMPLHVLGGIGDLLCLSRRDPLRYAACAEYARDIGPGESPYTEYDRKITAAACDWLRREPARHADNPWVLFVSFVSPHYPLIAPPAFYKLYDGVPMPAPRRYEQAERPRHPVIDAMARLLNYDDYFDPQRVGIALASYYGLCSFLDDNIGQVLSALQESGVADSTRVIYSTDHGDCLGNRGLWGKSVMYEESVAIPLLMQGAGIPEARSHATAVSHVDLYQTIIEAAGERLTPEEAMLPGRSLLGMVNGAVHERAVLSEYHDAGSVTAMFMVRVDRWKYVHYVGHQPQLFDLETDPREDRDLGTHADYEDVRHACEAKLRQLLNPEAVNKQAFSDQEALMAKYGGREAIKQRGDFGYSPVPGQTPQFAAVT
jgi:choline-sulfatase